MDTQVQRVVAWREQKRQAGYQPLTVWLKADVKHLIADLASQRRQEAAEVVSEAVRAYAGMHRTPAPPEYVDAPTVRRLLAEYVQELTAGQILPAPDVPTPPPHLPEDGVLLRGERGWLIQTVRAAARDLGRSTPTQVAHHINYKVAPVAHAMGVLAKRGALRRKGRVFFWVGAAGSDPSP